jgi:aryl-alcohol dehydrogenase-like predicted oxidoreductase
METRNFGRTGLRVSALGFGAAPMGYLNVDHGEAARLLNTVLDVGINLIDTAASYPDAEVVIGQAIASRRDQFVLVSKCGQAVPHLKGAGRNWSPELITATVDASLQRLRTDRLDVMLLHSCGLDVLQKGDALGALVRAREAGKVRYVGYSGDNEAAAFALALPDVAVLETSVSICDQANVDTVLPLAVKQNAGVLAKRPIANTAWKPLSEHVGIYASYAKPYVERFAAMGVSLSDLGDDGRGADWPEIALRFTLSQPGVHCAIIGTTRAEHARANVEAVDEGPLHADALRALREAFTRAQRAGGQPWPGLT